MTPAPIMAVAMKRLRRIIEHVLKGRAGRCRGARLASIGRYAGSDTRNSERIRLTRSAPASDGRRHRQPPGRRQSIPLNGRAEIFRCRPCAPRARLVGLHGDHVARRTCFAVDSSWRCGIELPGAYESADGIPTARSVDHVGFTVPDLDEAVSFFTRAVGCDLLYRTGPFFDSTGDWMSRHYGVHPRAQLETAMLRCGPSTNIELLAWNSPDGASQLSEARGIGAAHLAIYVDDLARAAAHLGAQRGVQILGRPTIVTGELNEGTEFLHTRLPWGMCLELVRRPALMPYSVVTAARLYGPASSWRQGQSPVVHRSDK